MSRHRQFYLYLYKYLLLWSTFGSVVDLLENLQYFNYYVSKFSERCDTYLPRYFVVLEDNDDNSL